MANSTGNDNGDKPFFFCILLQEVVSGICDFVCLSIVLVCTTCCYWFYYRIEVPSIEVYGFEVVFSHTIRGIKYMKRRCMRCVFVVCVYLAIQFNCITMCCPVILAIYFYLQMNTQVCITCPWTVGTAIFNFQVQCIIWLCWF